MKLAQLTFLSLAFIIGFVNDSQASSDVTQEINRKRAVVAELLRQSKVPGSEIAGSIQNIRDDGFLNRDFVPTAKNVKIIETGFVTCAAPKDWVEEYSYLLLIQVDSKTESNFGPGDVYRSNTLYNDSTAFTCDVKVKSPITKALEIQCKPAWIKTSD